MAVQEQVINAITYESTTSGATITLTDDAFGIVDAVVDLTDAIRVLTSRLSK